MVLIGLVGLFAGAINALVGSGTLVTFPTLVALGYPPVTATMSNAVGLVAGGVTATWGYRSELGGQGDRLRWQIPASLAGAVLGAYLLLHLPEKVFADVVPVLLVLALLLVVLGPRIQSWARRKAEEAGRHPEHVTPGRRVLLVVLALVVNMVAALGYTLVAFDRISWPVAGIIAVSSLIGGWVGARYGRGLSPNVLRYAIVVVGLIGLWRLLTV